MTSGSSFFEKDPIVWRDDASDMEDLYTHLFSISTRRTDIDRDRTVIRKSCDLISVVRS